MNQVECVCGRTHLSMSMCCSCDEGRKEKQQNERMKHHDRSHDQTSTSDRFSLSRRLEFSLLSHIILSDDIMRIMFTVLEKINVFKNTVTIMRIYVMKKRMFREEHSFSLIMKHPPWSDLHVTSHITRVIRGQRSHSAREWVKGLTDHHNNKHETSVCCSIIKVMRRKNSSINKWNDLTSHLTISLSSPRCITVVNYIYRMTGERKFLCDQIFL